LLGGKLHQVDDRFFSPVFPFDAADVLWEKAIRGFDKNDIITHVGNPVTCSRYSLVKDLISACEDDLNIELHPVSYTHFSADVIRPRDTTWSQEDAVYKTEYFDGLRKSYLQWKEVENDSGTES
jgi:dTDP-4-dehydrorhamnose reductase